MVRRKRPPSNPLVDCFNGRDDSHPHQDLSMRANALVQLRANHLFTGDRQWASVRALGAHVGDGWLDVTLHVDYRNRNGFIQHLERRMALDV